MNTRVLVTCRYPLVREAFAELLDCDPAIEARGTDVSGLLAGEDTPDIVLVVVSSEADARSYVTRLSAARPGVRIVLLLLLEDESVAKTALRLGVHGLADGSVSLSELRSLMRQIAAGEFTISSQLALRLARLHADAEHAATPASTESNLTERELEVLRLLVEGGTNRDIAARLSVSEHTVRAHLRVIMQKLQVVNRVQAAARAWQGNLITTSRGEHDDGNTGRRGRTGPF